MNTTALPAPQLARLAQADLLLVLADLVRGPAPTQPWSELPALLEMLGPEAPDGLRARWSALAAAAGESEARAWAVEHCRLFEGATVCPPNQTAYVRRDKGIVIGDLCGFYRAFGLEPRPDSGEKPDHLATQLQFLALLLVMRVRAEQAGREDDAQVAADAARAFADDHLSPWLGRFADHLGRVAALPVYQRLAEALEATWPALAAPAGWAPLERDDADPPAFDPLPPSDDCGNITDPLVPLSVSARP